MPSADIIKLAPTLSAEERYKLVVSDYHRELMGGKPLLSESERQSVTDCEKRATWEEYTRDISMLQWTNVFWMRDIETERLRVFGSWMMLNHAMEKILLTGGQQISEERRADQLTNVKERARFLEKQSMHFYCFPEAIKKIEQELYGTPILNDEKRKEMLQGYEAIDGLLEDHNGMIRAMCGSPVIKERFKFMAQDMESYLVKKPVPDAELVEQIVDEVRQIANLETEMLGR